MNKKQEELISVENALGSILENVSPLNSEVVAISNCFGRVLSNDIASRITQPPVAVSSMDGYAVRTIDTVNAPIKLKLIGESSAGLGFEGKVNNGETVRIFTGAPIPKGADAVVIQENTNGKDDQILIKDTTKIGDFIRPKGLDFKSGEVLLRAGTRMNPRHLSLAAAMNVPWVKVRRKPVIAILSSGNELVMPGEPIGKDQIISSNGIGIASIIQSWGGLGINLGIALDTPDSIRDLISNFEGADMLVTIGGASVGDYDLIKMVLGTEGLDIKFSRIAMRPGKPLIFGQIRGKPLLGLPGNPVSAGVTAMVFLKPIIEKMLGFRHYNMWQETAILGVNLKKNDRRQDYLRATLSKRRNGDLLVTPFKKQDSSMLATFTKADCLIVRKPFAPNTKKGARVPIIRLSF